MAQTRKTWQEKLQDSKDLPKTIEMTGEARTKWGAGVMVVPAPIDVDKLMHKVPVRRVTTVAELRGALARQAGVDLACPLTTGIFTWIAANASHEAESEGKRRVTPWWRTLKARGELNPKLPGGLDEQRRRLEAEGHQVFVKGKRAFVVDYEMALWSP